MVAGIVFFKIRNSFTRPIALSTCTRRLAIFLVTITSLAAICALRARKGGIVNCTPSGASRSWI